MGSDACSAGLRGVRLDNAWFGLLKRWLVINSIRSQINASSSGSPLYFIVEGPMD
jgi:hypothetical protein